MNDDKYWYRNKKSVFGNISSSNHSDLERVKWDFYSTDPIAIDFLLKHESFDRNIWECACGNGNLSKRLEKYGYKVFSSDLVDRGYGVGNVDFLKQKKSFNGDIITNPPYNLSTDFVLKGLELSKRKVAMFLKVQFLEGMGRYEKLFKNNPPSKMYVFVNRVNCYPNNKSVDFRSGVCYCWYVWDKEYMGEPRIKWIDNR